MKSFFVLAYMEMHCFSLDAFNGGWLAWLRYAVQMYFK